MISFLGLAMETGELNQALSWGKLFSFIECSITAAPETAVLEKGDKMCIDIDQRLFPF